MIHELKCEDKFFRDMWHGLKRFEIRKNDRDFQDCDVLWLRETYNGHYTKKAIKLYVVKVFSLEGLELLREGVVAMSCMILLRTHDYENERKPYDSEG